MKLIKDMSLLALGVGATLIYQRYSADMMNCIEQAIDKIAKRTTNTLDNME